MSAPNISDRPRAGGPVNLSPSQLAFAEVRDWVGPNDGDQTATAVEVAEPKVANVAVKAAELPADSGSLRQSDNVTAPGAGGPDATVRSPASVPNPRSKQETAPSIVAPHLELAPSRTIAVSRDVESAAGTSSKDVDEGSDRQGGATPLESRELSRGPLRAQVVAAVVLFPLTLYLLVGSGILYLLFCVERAARRLISYFAYNDIMDEPDYSYGFGEHLLIQRLRYFIYRRNAIRWHVRGPMLTFLFPVIAPVLAIGLFSLFCWAMLRATIKWIGSFFFAAADELWTTVTGWFSEH